MRGLVCEKVPQYTCFLWNWDDTQIKLIIKSRITCFWTSVNNGKESKLSKLFYTVMFKERQRVWIHCINNIFVSIGRSDIFRTASVNSKAVEIGIIRTLSDIHAQEQDPKLNASLKGNQYLIFKDNLNPKKNI